jgi:hypothetical protein
MSVPKADLVSLCNGAALELFQSALNQVNQNIKDPNTSATKKRSITIKFDMTPYVDRSGANIVVNVESKLSSHNGVNGSMFIHKQAGVFEAFTQDTRQIAMFDEESRVEEPDPEKKLN